MTLSKVLTPMASELNSIAERRNEPQRLEQVPEPKLAVADGRPSQGWPWAEVLAPLISEKQQWPRISVITPSFNQGNYLEAAMRSVLQQVYPNLEYIVLDGGSTDRSLEIIKHYASHLQYWHSERDEGQADAIAKGLRRATGNVLCWLNADDLLLPGALWRVAKIFKRNPGTQFVFGNRLVINSDDEVVGRHIWPSFLTRYHWAMGQPMAQECCFWTRELYEEVGGVDRTRLLSMDHHLFYRMWRVAKFHKTPAVLGCMRIPDDTENAMHQENRQRELAQSCREFGLREPGPLMARMVNHLNRRQIRREKHALPLLRTGARLSEIYSQVRRADDETTQF